MRKACSFALIALLGLVVPFAAAQETAFPERDFSPPTLAPDNGDTVMATIQRLELRQRIAQLLVVTATGLQGPLGDDKTQLQRYTPGGFVIPKLLSATSAAQYVNAVRVVEQLHGIPILIGADFYGLARRERGAPSGFVQLPTLLSLAATRNVDATRETAQVIADHMAAMGFDFFLGPNLEFAPTLPEATGSVDCLGSDPQFISDSGAIFHEVLLEAGIRAMAMGFPGGGANRTAKSAAVLTTPRQVLREQDLKPYIDLIAAGVEILHVGNTIAPTLDDANLPSSVSPVLITTILRRDLGFEGLIVAGPMDELSMSQRYDPAEAAMRALAAGADMVYFGAPGTHPMRVVDKIAQAILEGQFPETRILEALERVLRYKSQWVARDRPALREKDAAKVGQGRKVMTQLQAIERQAITLVQNRGQVLPLSKESSMPVGVTGVLGTEAIKTVLERDMKPVSQQQIATAQRAGEIHDFEIERITSRIRGIRTVVVVLTDNLGPKGQVELVRALKAKGVTVVVVLLGYPQMLPYLAEADAIVLAYPDNATYDATLAAVADTLAGRGAIGFADTVGEARVQAGQPRVYNINDVLQVPPGRLPVTVSETYRAGLAVPYLPTQAVKRAEWRFGDEKKIRKDRVEYTFQNPGAYAVELSLVDQRGQSTSHTYTIVVE